MEVPQNSLVTRDFRGRWADAPRCSLPPVAAVLAGSHAEALGAVREWDAQGSELLLLAAGRADQQLRQELHEEGFAIVHEGQAIAPAQPRTADPGRVWLLTSGSTGRPSRVVHTLESLTTVAAPQPPRRWLCAYTPGSYAWWQVVTLARTVPGQDAVFIEHDEMDRWPQIAADEGVTAISGTPTFWRHGLLRGGADLARASLQQITLGGEPVDQPILDALREAFPAARISWIYASSEAGAAIAVHDGKAGFPVAWLDRDDPDRPRIGIDDGELVLTSQHAGHTFDGPIATGDRVEVRDGRVHIVGRRSSDEINVGGTKVAASTVRSVLLEHPEVSWASVRGRSAPLTGAVVVADVVCANPLEERELIMWARQRLPEAAVPRRVRVLDSIPLKETLKSDV